MFSAKSNFGFGSQAASSDNQKALPQAFGTVQHKNPDDREKNKTDIAKLPYQEDKIRTSGHKLGKHLGFTIDPLKESGLLYVSVDKEDNNDTKDSEMETDTQLYFFDEPNKLDESKSYTDFIEKTYKLFQPLLVESQYQDYYDDNEELQIGVIDQMKDTIIYRKETLIRILDTFKYNLLELLKAKSESGEIDNRAYGYQDILHVISLLHALKFSSDEDRLSLYIEWVNRADSIVVFEDADDVDRSYSSVNFWSNGIKRLISRGFFAEAIEFIDSSGYQVLGENEETICEFNLIEDLKIFLGSYDIINFSLDLNEFLMWKKSLVAFKDFIQTTNFQNLELSSSIYEIVLLMTGSQSAIEQSTFTWYERFLCLFLYQMPSSELVGEYVVTAKKDQVAASNWESICIELFDGNYLTVVSLLESLDGPMATFISVLFEASGLFQSYLSLTSGDKNLDNVLNSATDKKLESLAFEFFSCGNKRLFPVGVGILKALNTSGTREIISEILPSYKCETNDDFEWCLGVCADLKLTKTSTNLYKSQGHYLLSQGLLMESLQCFAQAKEYGIISRIIWSLFEISLIENKPVDDEVLLDTIESLNDNEPVKILQFSPALKQALSPYAVLVDFFKNISSDKVADAVDCLIRLLSFTYLPKHEKVVLFAQCFYFLNNEKLESEIGITQLYTLTQQLETYQTELQAKEDTGADKEDYEEDAAKKSKYFYEFVTSSDACKGELENYDWRLTFAKEKMPLTIDEFLAELRAKIGYSIGKRYVQSSV